LKRYKRKSVEVGVFRRGGSLECEVYMEGGAGQSLLVPEN